MIPTYVIDASVAVKWFYRVKEEHVEKALSLFDQTSLGHTHLIVPDLFFYELGNVFVNDKLLSDERVKKQWEILERLEVESFRIHENLFMKTSTLARVHHLTFYDAAYLAVALERNIPLITEDRELLGTKLPFVFSLAQFGKRL